MRTLFWNVDTQYDFMRADGKLYVTGAEGIENALYALTNFAQQRGIKVVNTADWHNENTAEISKTPNFMQTFPEHCMIHTPGALFIPATAPDNPYVIDWSADRFDPNEVLQRRNLVLYKDKFDVFAGTKHADEVVKLLAPDCAVVYGVATNVCVNDAVLGLLERNVRVYVPTDAIKELPGLPLPYTTWQQRGAVLTTTRDICSLLEGA